MNDEAFVLFLDMLGFRALTEAHPRRLDETSDADGWTLTSQSRSASVFDRFHSVLDQVLGGSRVSGGPTEAMVFSDCAFLVFENALLAAVWAGDLMRYFITNEVPVRMGLAHGTCYVTRFTSDRWDTFNLTRAIFHGTAVVRSHDAERLGGKGCRVFVHPSFRDFLTDVRLRIKVLPLPDLSTDAARKAAEWELCYLHDDAPYTTSEESPAHQDLRLRHAVERMRRQSEPMDNTVAVQYSETLDALERMRQVMNRAIILD